MAEWEGLFGYPFWKACFAWVLQDLVIRYSHNNINSDLLNWSSSSSQLNGDMTTFFFFFLPSYGIFWLILNFVFWSNRSNPLILQVFFHVANKFRVLLLFRYVTNWELSLLKKMQPKPNQTPKSKQEQNHHKLPNRWQNTNGNHHPWMFWRPF